MDLTRRLPPLKALRALEAIHQSGSIMGAARQLNVSHSAISHQVKALDAWSNEPLFIRQGRMTLLTDAGKSLASVTHEAFDAIRHEMDLLPMRSLRSVSIACLPLVATGWLLPRLASFNLRHPEINLHVSLSQTDKPVTPPPDIEIRFGRRAQLLAGDIVLIAGDAVPVCAPRLLNARAAADLLTNGPVLFDEDLRMWTRWYETTRHPRGPASGSSLILEGSALLQSAAIAGLGVALCRKAFLTNDLADGRLVALSDHAIDLDWCYFMRCDADKRRRPEVETVVASVIG